ncbi:MAG TPA: serine hydrolase [Gemmatimonadales bacterium]
MVAADLRTGATVSLRADEAFPTASMIKVPIMVAVFDRIGRGEIAFTDTAPSPRAMAKYPEGDLVAQLSDTAHVAVEPAPMMSLTFSDNTASLWLQQIAGRSGDQPVARAERLHDDAGERAHRPAPGAEALEPAG